MRKDTLKTIALVSFALGCLVALLVFVACNRPPRNVRDGRTITVGDHSGSKAEERADRLYSMKLMEFMTVSSWTGAIITRVPGGWLYSDTDGGAAFIPWKEREK